MTPLHPGDQIDHYRVEGVAARSGMASIFRGTDLNNGRPVAIKVPHPEMERDPVFSGRFQREHEIGRQLDHPGVTKVMPDSAGDHGYMVMEWAEGRPLRDLLRGQRKIERERATRITLRILETLEYVHSQGIVHRDLKPENIIIGAEDRIKLIDFGIAAKEGARRLTLGKLTDAIGTPDYISPEQANGKSGDVRSDLYAAGVILYEMLTGKVPFTGRNASQVMNDRLLNNPIPPCELDPEISPQLQEIVYRALERDPARRYARAREFAWDLAHQDQVGVADRLELRDWKWHRTPWPLRALRYAALILIPAVVFALLFYVARHV